MEIAKTLAVLGIASSFYFNFSAVSYEIKAIRSESRVQAQKYEQEAVSRLVGSCVGLLASGLASVVLRKEQRAPPRELEQTE